MFIRPEIRRIMAYDEAYGTEYLKTLFTYLENLGSMIKASELLQIHYNTMKYRIQQIESICGTEFHDRPGILVQLYLSMKLQDIQQ